MIIIVLNSKFTAIMSYAPTLNSTHVLAEVVLGSFVGALVSVTFDVTTLLLFLSVGAHRLHPAELVIWRVACSTVLDVLVIIGYTTNATEHVCEGEWGMG